MDLWPQIMKDFVRNGSKFKFFDDVIERTPLRNWYYWYHAIGRGRPFQTFQDPSTLDVPTKVLIHWSASMLRGVIGLGHSMQDHLVAFNHAFNEFIAESSWRYLSDPKRNKSARLPPIQCLHELPLNQAIYGPETEYLERLRAEHGLVILNPRWTHYLESFALDSPTNFHLFVDEFLAFNKWLTNHDNSADPEFPWFMTMQFILAVICGQDYDLDFTFRLENAHYAQQRFEAVVRSTMAHLWEQNKTGIMFECLTLELLKSNAVEILLQDPFYGPSLSDFIDILSLTSSANLMLTTPSIDPQEIFRITQSIYYWFVEHDVDKSSTVLRGICSTKVLSVLSTIDAVDLEHIDCDVDPDPKSRQRYLNMVALACM